MRSRRATATRWHSKKRPAESAGNHLEEGAEINGEAFDTESVQGFEDAAGTERNAETPACRQQTGGEILSLHDEGRR